MFLIRLLTNLPDSIIILVELKFMEVKMKTCTFFGHRDAPQSLRAKLKLKIAQLIIRQGVDCFYVGNNGLFDAMALSVLREIAATFTHIRH